MRTKNVLPFLLSLAAGFGSVQASAAVNLSAEANKVFTEVCAACHAQFTDPAAVADEAAEIIRRLDPAAPEEIQMPPAYAETPLSKDLRLRIIKELQQLK